MVSGRVSGMVSGRVLRKKLNKTLPKLKKSARQSAEKSAKKSADAANQLAQVAQRAQASAKIQLDHVLLGLGHKGLGLKESSEVMGRIGRTILDTASMVLEQISTSELNRSWLPTWIKDYTSKSKPATTEGSRSATLDVTTAPAFTESSSGSSPSRPSARPSAAATSALVSTESAPALEMQEQLSMDAAGVLGDPDATSGKNVKPRAAKVSRRKTQTVTSESASTKKRAPAKRGKAKSHSLHT